MDNELADAYSQTSVLMARSGRAEEALACQWACDMHKLQAALWSKASNSNDPTTAFFALATRAMTAAAAIESPHATSQAGALAAARGAWITAARELNIPLVFRPAVHLDSLTVLDVERVGADLTDGMPAGAYLVERTATADGPADAARIAIVSYLAQVSEQTGETSRMTALAAWTLMQSKGISSGDVVEVHAVARQVLGPVAWVRVTPYLEYAATGA